MNKKLIVLLGTAFVLILSLAFVIPAYTASQDGQVRVWVEFRPGQQANVERVLRGEGAQFHYTFDNLSSFVVTLPEKSLSGIRRNPNVVMVEEDAKRYLDAQTIPYGIDMVQARQIWDADLDGIVDAGAPTGAGRKVCIIDSGLWTAHEDFQGVNITGGYPSDWNRDRCGHGTHVAGTIAAMNNQLGVVGVSPGNVSLYILKVFGDNCSWTYASTLADAANRCQSAGANVISMSLGGGVPNFQEQRTFQNLYNAGILSIAAAGNTGANEHHYPASYSTVVGVAALDQNKQRADFSTYNSDVELAAPGVGVLSTVPFLDENWITVDGVRYTGNHIDESKRGDASGLLADGGRCTATNAAWSGKVVLCERGDISFADKVKNVENSGGTAAVIYNNVPGGFSGTMNGVATNLIAISLSQEDGQFLKANKLGVNGDVHSTITYEQSAYEYYDGTSMATPHVSGVAAVIWSWKPSLTNAQVRDAMNKSAEDLGAAGRDNYYGNGLVQAYDAWVYLGGGTPTDTPPTVTITNPAEGATVAGTVTITANASDDQGVTQVEFFVDGTSLGVDTSAPYEIAWNTTTVADGTHQVRAVATDTIAQTAEDINTVTVNNGGGTPTTMHVGDLDGSKSGTRRWSATVTITVHDANHNPLSGVTVTGSWSAGASGTSSCTTNSSGQCSVSKTNIANTVSSVTFSVTNLSKSGYTYASSSNHDPDGDSNGTSITITK